MPYLNIRPVPSFCSLRGDNSRSWDLVLKLLSKDYVTPQCPSIRYRVRIFPYCLMAEGWTSLRFCDPSYQLHVCMPDIISWPKRTIQCRLLRVIILGVYTDLSGILPSEFLWYSFAVQKTRALPGTKTDASRSSPTTKAQPLRCETFSRHYSSSKALTRRVLPQESFSSRRRFFIFFTDTRKTFSLLWSNDY